MNLFQRYGAGICRGQLRLKLEPDTAHDRADVVATAVIEIITTALIAWAHHEDVDLSAVRGEVKSLLCDEFHDLEQEIVSDLANREGGE
jgi:hypothetical protein